MFCQWFSGNTDGNGPMGPEHRSKAQGSLRRHNEPAPLTGRNQPQQTSLLDPSLILPVAFVASAAYIVRLRRVRLQRHMAFLRSSRFKANGASKAWQQAFMELANKGKPTSAARKPAQNSQPSRSDPRRLPGGFLDSAIARQAAREELQDVGPLYSDFGPTLGRLGSLFQGKDIDLNHGPQASGVAKGSASRELQRQPSQGAETQARAWPAQPQVVNAHFHECVLPKTSLDGRGRRPGQLARPKELTPRQTWQRAFGPGHAASLNENDGWEQLAKDAAARQVPVPSSSKKDFDAYSELAADANTASDSKITKSDSKIEKVKAKPKPEVKVNDALHAELDQLLLSQHREKDNRKKDDATESVQQDRSESAVQPASAGRSAQHISMDNLFLESQLAQAAEEGREDRLARESRDFVMVRGDGSGQVGVTAKIPSRQFGGNGEDFSIDDLSATLLTRKPRTTKKDHSEEPMNRKDEASALDGQEAKSSSSDPPAPLPEVPVRRKPGRPRKPVEVDETSDEQPAKNPATRARAKAKEEAQASLDNGSRTARLILEPEDLDEALVHFKDPAQVEAERLFREDAENAELQVLRSKVTEMEATMAEMRIAMSQMGVWGDEVHRRLGLRGSCPTSPDKPN